MLKVTKSNELVYASYKLTLTEIRIVLYGISKINPMRDNDMPLTHTINVSELAEFYNISKDGLYSEIKTALCDRFFNRKIVINDNIKRKTTIDRWISHIDYDHDSRAFTYTYNPELKPHLIKLENMFTTYVLKHISKMKSIYSIRIYEMCLVPLKASKKNNIKFSKKLDRLKKMLDICDKYKDLCNFKLRVLETAKTEINLYSDIQVDYTILKNGRTERCIEFHVSYKKIEKNNPIVKQNIKSEQIKNYHSYKIKISDEKLKKTELQDHEIDNCVDIGRLKYTYWINRQIIESNMHIDEDKRIKFTQPNGDELTLIEISNIKEEKMQSRLNLLFKEGHNDVDCFWINKN